MRKYVYVYVICIKLLLTYLLAYLLTYLKMMACIDWKVEGTGRKWWTWTGLKRMEILFCKLLIYFVVNDLSDFSKGQAFLNVSISINRPIL